MHPGAGLAGLLLALQASAALGCGHCVEDKVAAVYDYAVVTKAFSQKQQVAFFGIDGTLMMDDGLRREIEVMAADVPGVDRRSPRVSLESAALSVAFDPRRVSYASLQRSLERKLAPKKLSLLPMRVMDQPARIKAAPQ